MKKLVLATLAMFCTKVLCNGKEVLTENNIQTAVELEMAQKLIARLPYFLGFIVEPTTQSYNYGKYVFEIYNDIQRCKQGKEPLLTGTLGSCKDLALTLNNLKLNNPSHDIQKAETVGAIWKKALGNPL